MTLESECVRYEKAKHVIEEDRAHRPQNSCDRSNILRKQSTTDHLSATATKPTSSVDSCVVSTPRDSRTNRSHRNQGHNQETKQTDDRDQKRRLRAEGKCFICEETNHIERNCPKRWQTKDKRRIPHMQLNAIGMSPAEVRLAALEEGTELGLFTLGLTHSETPDLQQAKQDLVKARALSILYDAVPLTLDQEINPGNSLFQPGRFTLEDYGGPETYLLSDNFTLDTHIIYYEDLVDPNFDIVSWLHLRKAECYDDLIFDRCEKRWHGPVPIFPECLRFEDEEPCTSKHLPCPQVTDKIVCRAVITNQDTDTSPPGVYAIERSAA